MTVAMLDNLQPYLAEFPGFADHLCRFAGARLAGPGPDGTDETG